MSEAQEEQGVALEAPLSDFLNARNLDDILDLLSDRTVSLIFNRLRARIGVKEDNGRKLIYVEAGAKLRITITPIFYLDKDESSRPEYRTSILIGDQEVAFAGGDRSARESLANALRELSARVKLARRLVNLVGDLSSVDPSEVVEYNAPLVVIAKNIDEAEWLISMADSIVKEERRTIGQELDELIDRLDQLEDLVVERLDG